MEFFTDILKDAGLMAKDIDSDDNYQNSDMTSNMSVKSDNGPGVDVDLLLGATEVQTKGGPPKKGKRYMAFTILMIIILSSVVVYDTLTGPSMKE